MSAWIILGGISLLFFIAELAFLDFSCLVFGIAFACVAILSAFIDMPWWIWLLLACVLSLMFFIIIKTPIKKFFSAKKTNDNFLDEKGIGVVKNGMVYFKGTYWQSTEILGFSEGEQLEILGVKDGEIIIKKSKNL